MNMEKEIKKIITKAGFVREGKRDIWTRGSWTIRFFEDDIEIYDSPEESAFYYVGNVNYIDINLILADVDYFSKK